MTISLVDAVQTTQGTPSTHTAIAGIATGDLYIEFAHNTGGGSVPVLDTVSTFTTLVTGTDWAGRNYTYGYRVRTGTEGTLSTTSGSALLADIFFALSGIDQTTPIESIVSATGSFTSVKTVSASTPTADNCWHIVVFANTNSGVEITIPPSGYTLLGSRLVAGQGNIYAYYKDLGPGSSGISTGSVSVTYASSVGGLSTGFIVRSSASAPVNWTINSPTVNSDAGTVTLTVTLDGPAPGGGFSGLVNTYDITAVAGVDYTAQVDVPFSISAGNTTGDIVIPILP